MNTYFNRYGIIFNGIHCTDICQYNYGIGLYVVRFYDL